MQLKFMHLSTHFSNNSFSCSDCFFKRENAIHFKNNNGHSTGKKTSKGETDKEEKFSTKILFPNIKRNRIIPENLISFPSKIPRGSMAGLHCKKIHYSFQSRVFINSNRKIERGVYLPK